VPVRHLAVVQRRLKWSELGSNLLPLLDRAYVQVRAGRVAQSGHNVFVYRDATKDSVTVEVGVEVSLRSNHSAEISEPLPALFSLESKLNHYQLTALADVRSSRTVAVEQLLWRNT